ncbi:DUF433 domain-containing protein [Thermoflexus hugenholtzii]
MDPERRELAPGIEANPEVVSGAPVLQGTRIPVWAVLRAVADLGDIEEAARAYEVPPERIRQALYCAADLLEGIHMGILE